MLPHNQAHFIFKYTQTFIHDRIVINTWTPSSRKAMYYCIGIFLHTFFSPLNYYLKLNYREWDGKWRPPHSNTNTNSNTKQGQMGGVETRHVWSPDAMISYFYCTFFFIANFIFYNSNTALRFHYQLSICHTIVTCLFLPFYNILLFYGNYDSNTTTTQVHHDVHDGCIGKLVLLFLTFF